MIDLLRSCYSTKMQTVAGGAEHNMDWYFCLPTAPVFGHTHFGSLNWQRPSVPDGVVGEVRGRPRPWRDGSIPFYVAANSTNTQQGLRQWFLDGRPAPPASPQALNWMGQSAFPGDLPVGTFPPHPAPLSTTPTLVTNKGYTWTLIFAGSDIWSFQSTGKPGGELVLHWMHPTGPKWDCFPNVYTLVADEITIQPHLLRCLTYDAPSNVSTWDDSGLGILAGGELLTLHGT